MAIDNKISIIQVDNKKFCIFVVIVYKKILLNIKRDLLYLTFSLVYCA